MKYIDCLSVVALYLEDKNLYDYLLGKGEISEETQRQIDNLCAFVDIVINEICCEYFPITKTEKIVATNNKIEYEKLSERVVDVRKVKKNGKKINYDLFAYYIGVDGDGEYEVCYDYSPKGYSGNIQDTIGLYGRITPRIVGFGAMAEYCLANNRFDEAITYDKMFKDALIGVEKRRGNLKIKQRRWE